MTLESHTDTHYRPTLEDLRQRAEEGGYGGGRGKMDSREWYELCYFEPLEDLLYEGLEAKYYPEMDARNISVCVSVWIYAHSVDTPTYEAVSDRILWLPSDGINEIKPETAIRQAWERGFIYYNIDAKDPAAKTIEANEVVITLRQDIEEFLSELVDKECAASDADIITKHGKEAVEEIQKIYREKLLEFEEDAVKFLCRKNEKGEDIPLTEQERKDWIESIEQKNKR